MGSGYREFAAGEVHSSANINGYLMKQAVMSFAHATARDDALPSPEDGMMAYTRDDKILWVYEAGATTAGWCPLARVDGDPATPVYRQYIPTPSGNDYWELEDTTNTLQLIVDGGTSTPYMEFNSSSHVGFEASRIRLNDAQNSDSYFEITGHGTASVTAKIVGYDGGASRTMMQLVNNANYSQMSGIDEIQTEDGSAGDPSYTWRSASTTGMWNNSGKIAFSVSGTATLTIQSSGTVPNVYPTPAAGTSWVVGSGGELNRASSSIRYKTLTDEPGADMEGVPRAVGDMPPIGAVDALAAAVRPYYYTESPDVGEIVSLIAEPAADADPRFVWWNDEGQPEDVNDRMILGHVIREVADLRRRMAEVEQ